MLLKNKIEIKSWLKKYEIQNYELIEDKEYGYVVNVNSFVNLYNKKLKSIDVKFNIVEDSFDCGDNKLTSLLGCPKIVKGNFSCNDNNLITLIGCPEIVNGYFYCVFNKLESLIGCPKIVSSDFFCQDNKLNIEGIKNLSNVEIKNNYIDLSYNEQLNNLQDIYHFNELKQILTIYQEKADLMKMLEITDKSVEKLDLLISKESYIINKDKINKI